MEKLPASPGQVTGRPHRKAGQEEQHWDDRKSKGQGVMRWIGPRRSGLTWQESMWNRLKREKQMTTDARRLMRLGTAVSKERSPKRPHSSIVKPPEIRLRFLRTGEIFVGLEPYDGKLSSTVLRGGRAGNSPLPLDKNAENAGVENP